LSDDLVAEQQLPVRPAITVVGVVWLLRIFRVIGLLGRRLTKLESFVERLRRPAVTVPATGIRWIQRRRSVVGRLQRQRVAVPATGFQRLQRRRSVAGWLQRG